MASKRGPCFSCLSCPAAVTGIVTHEIKENALNLLCFLRCLLRCKAGKTKETVQLVPVDKPVTIRQIG